MVSLSPTAAVRARAAALRKQGVSVHDLSAGELDLPTPEHIVAAAQEAAAVPANHRYGPTAGNENLRTMIADRQSARSKEDLGSTSVLVTHGAKQALFNAFSAVLHPGDEVLVPAPYWATFPESVKLAGGVPVIVEPDRHTLKINVNVLEEAATQNTQALLLCSPNNPTSFAYSAEELAPLLDWVVRRGIRLIIDETYRDLTWNRLPDPVAVDPRVSELLVRVGSVSKSFAMTGWRVGWMIGASEVVAKATAVQSHTTSNVSGIAQAAALAALSGPDVTAGFRTVLQRRLDLCRSVLEPVGLLDRLPDGGFYLFPDTTEIDPDDGVVASHLAEQAVLTVPGSGFGAPGRLRISFAVADDHLAAGLERIALLATSTR